MTGTARSGAVTIAAVILSLAVAGGVRAAVELPPTCRDQTLEVPSSTTIANLRKEVEAEAETDPARTVAIMCAAIPRVAREKGEDSVELAWWLGSLAMPLIAYMDRHAEAEPLLDAAERIYTRALGAGAEELSDIHVAHAWIHFRQGRLAESKAAWERALSIRERKPGPRSIELQKVLVGLAQVQVMLREFDGAKATLARAMEILKRNGDESSEAAAAIENTLTNVAIREENYPEARRHAEAQIAVEKRMNNPAAQLVPAYVLLAQVLDRLDEFEDSEAAVREAVRLSEAADGPLQRHRLLALTRLASLLHDRDRAPEALDAARRALAEAERTLAPDAPRLVGVLQIAADAERAMGHLPESLHAYERAAAIVDRQTKDVEKSALVAFHRGMGELWFALGDAAAARAALTRGLEAAGEEATLSTERAGVLRALAEMTLGENPAQSRAWLAEAAELLRRRLPDGHPAILRVIDDLCAVEIRQSPEEADDCEAAAARVAGSGDASPSTREEVYANQSLLADARGDAAAAYSWAVKALAAATALGTPDPLFRAQIRLARRLEARNAPELAILFGKQAVAEVERLRGRFVGEDERLDRGFVRDKAPIYRDLSDWLIEAGRLDEGLAVLRALKSEELRDFALRGADRDAGPADPKIDLTEGERALWERYARTLDADPASGEEIARLARLREAGRLSVKERERLETLLAGQQAAEASRATRIDRFIVETTRTSAGAKVRGQTRRTETLASEARRLGPDAALALYLEMESHLRIVIATRREQIDVEIPVASRALRSEIGEFLDRVGERGDVGPAARQLYETVVRPVDLAAERAGAKRLVLQLDGALRYLPFGALSDGKRLLVDKYAIEVRAPAGETPASARTAGALQVRGLGVTREVAGFRALPAVADELRSIVRGPIAGLPSDPQGDGALPGEGFADAAFTESRFNALLDGPHDFSVLHLGTHFSLRPGNSLRSFLVLGDGTRLTLDALQRMDFSGIELLTLSACETGLGGAVTDDGREIEGLSAIVRRRGARRVVASLWPVEDVSTARLMAGFYGGLASGGADASRALQRAQRGLRGLTVDGRHPYEHPYYWAGFVMTGTNQP